VYSTQEVLTTIDTHMVWVLLAGAAVMGGAYTQYIRAIQMGFRHRTHALPVFANMYFFAHDVMFAARYQHWFSEINHWMFKLFWFAIIPFVALECVVHYQTLKYSREELFPGRNLTQRQYVIAYLAMQLGVAAVFGYIYSLLDDPLFLLNFSLTEIVSNAFNLPMLLSRRSRKGQSLVLAGGLLLGSNIGFFFLLMPVLSPTFTRLPFLAVGVCVTGMNLFYMWLLRKHPPYEAPAQEPEQLALSAAPTGT
jgi:hypothetical protein